MRVTMLLEVSDPRRRYTAGEVVEDMPDEQARRWIEAGWAVWTGAAPPPAVPPKPAA